MNKIIYIIRRQTYTATMATAAGYVFWSGTPKTIKYPTNLFDAEPTVNLTAKCNYTVWLSETNGVDKTQVAFYDVAPQSLGMTYVGNIEAKGRWK